jgi:hypothetical protein
MNYEVAVVYERCYHGIGLVEPSKIKNHIAVMIECVPTETQRGISFASLECYCQANLLDRKNNF